MLLRALHDLAHARGWLDDTAFDRKPVRWIIPIDSSGTLIGVGLIETTGDADGPKNRGKLFDVPRTSRAKDAGGIAEFLADGMTSVFGLDAEPDKVLSPKQRSERDRNNKIKTEDFFKQIEHAHEAAHLPELKFLLEFHRLFMPSKILRWGTSSESKQGEKNKWWVKTANGADVPLGNGDMFTFQVAGQILLLEDRLRDYWRSNFAREMTEKSGEAVSGICLLTGDQTPIASTHLPKIKGVPDTQSFGASLVSFDKASFVSYGFDQSHNAPVGIDASRAYAVALNRLITDQNSKLLVGRTMVCFWAKQQVESGSFFARMLNKPDSRSVRDFLKAPWQGVNRGLVGPDRFYSVTLSGNSGRVVVRHWLDTTVERAREQLRQWFLDLEIVSFNPEPEETDTPPHSIFKLACATVREAKDIRADVPAQLYRAAIEGTPVSVMLLKPVLHRFQADLMKYGTGVLNNISRFALIRLILNRNPKEVVMPSKIDESITDEAYLCGRLLAVLQNLQDMAHNYNLKTGIVERYYGAASSSPASVFPVLLRLARHHMKKCESIGKIAMAKGIEKRIGQILVHFRPAGSGLPPEFPRVFDLQAQGRFALGFYQQKAYRPERQSDEMAGEELPEPVSEGGES